MMKKINENYDFQVIDFLVLKLKNQLAKVLK